MRLVGLCLPWSLGGWRGLDVGPPPQGVLSLTYGLRSRKTKKDAVKNLGCVFNAKHPLAPKAGNFAGSQVRGAGAQGESTSCLRVFGWHSGKGAAGNAGCVPRRRKTCRNARASRKERRGRVRQCLELTNILPGRNTAGSCHPVVHRCPADTAEGKCCHLRSGLHSEF